MTGIGCALLIVIVSALAEDLDNPKSNLCDLRVTNILHPQSVIWLQLVQACLLWRKSAYKMANYAIVRSHMALLWLANWYAPTDLAVSCLNSLYARVSLLRGSVSPDQKRHFKQAWNLPKTRQLTVANEHCFTAAVQCRHKFWRLIELQAILLHIYGCPPGGNFSHS